MPLIVVNLKQREPTLKLMAQECAQMVAYFTQSGLCPTITSLGKFAPVRYDEEDDATPGLNLFYNLFKGLGDDVQASDTCTEKDVKQIQNTKLRTIQQLFSLYSLGCKISLVKDTLVRL